MSSPHYQQPQHARKTAATMYSRVFPRTAANAAACVNSGATRATSASAFRRSAVADAASSAPAAFSGLATTNAAASSSSSRRVIGVGRRVGMMVERQQSSSVAWVGGGAEGSWQPRAFSARGQRVFSPLGSYRSLSSTSQEDRSKEEEEEEANTKEGAGGEQGGDAGSEESDDDVEALREELAKSEDKLKDTTEKALYLAAEMENVRAIAKRDAESARLYAVQKFAKQLLDVADNLERAIASAREAGSGGDTSHDVLLQGVEMTSQELAKVFASQGLEKFGEVAEKFDPHLHDAMFEYEDANQEPGTLGQVLKAGYKLHGRVIRAAQVGTVKAA